MIRKKTRFLIVILISSVGLWYTIDSFADYDNDGIASVIDNCPYVPNSDQKDFDGDNAGNACDQDDDNDGVLDEHDAFDNDPTEWADFDNDNIGDNADIDDDNDMIVDMIDAFDNDPTEWADFDFDGIGATKDTDDDNDGLLDFEDPYPILPTEQLAKEYLDDIQTCALAYSEEERTLCYSQFFQRVVKQEDSNSDPIALTVALAKLGAIDDCHFTTHAIAHASFEENPNVIDLLSGVDSAVCRGAFYHGAIASYFNMLKEAGHSSPLATTSLCNTFYGTSNYQDCIHGLGHGLVLFYSNDLKSAVDSCNQMSFYQNQICIKGVMMQYTDNKINEDGITKENLSTMCPESELNSQDYQQCVMSIGTSFAFRSFHNFDTASKYCKLIEDERAEELCLAGLELEIKDSERYKVSPLTQDTREKFQPQTVTTDLKEYIVDIRSPATILNFNYIKEIKLIQFSFDKPSYIILYIPNELLPSSFAVTINGKIPNNLVVDSETIDGYTAIQLLPKESGTVLISGI